MAQGNIAFVSHNARNEGAPVMVLRAAGALRARGWRVSLIALAGGELAGRFDRVLDPEAAAREVAAAGCSHVLLHTVISAATAPVFRRLAPAAAVVAVFHEMRVPMFPWYTAESASHLHGALFVSESCAATYRALFGTATPLLVTHNWLDAAAKAVIDAAPRLAPATRVRLGATDPRDFLLVCVGCVSPHKGQAEFVLGAFAAMARADPRLRLALIGTVYDAEAARAMLAACPVGSLTLAGPLPGDEVAACVRAADAVLQNSTTESFCLAAHEALYAGVPVVASRVGGLAEQIEHGVCGLLHAPGDMAAAGSNLAALVSDAALRARLGAAGRLRVLGGYREAEGVAAYEAAVAQTSRRLRLL